MDQNFEPIAPVKKKTRGPIRVSLPVMLLSLLLVGLFVFMATYVPMTLEAERKINEAYADAARYEKLLEVAEIYDKYYYHDIDKDAAADALAGLYGTAVGDRYTSYYTAEEWAEEYAASTGNATGIGVYVVMSEEGYIRVARVMADSPALSAGIKEGDLITHVDGHDVLTVGYEGSVDLVLGERGTDVSFEIIRNGEKLSITLTRGKYDPQTVFAETLTYEGKLYGYIDIVQFERTTPTQFKNAVNAMLTEGVEGLLFDVRDNPGGDLGAIVDMLDFLLPEGPIVHIRSADESENMTYTSSALTKVELPMTVLVNGNTASAAELFTSALKDYDDKGMIQAEIVGVKTFGKGCGQTGEFLSDGSLIYVTNFFYDPPYTENYDGIGISPDHKVEMSAKYQTTNLFLVPHEEDPQFQKALEVLSSLTK